MNAPNLRFKGFNEGWVSKKLNSICDFSKGKALSKADLSDTGEPCILYGELYTKYGDIINSVSSKTNCKSKSLIKGKKNDVLIPSSGETALDIASASSLNVDYALIGGDINILTPHSDVNGHFLSLQINGKRKRKLATFAQGASIIHLYADSIKILECYFPTLEEQNKISDFFVRLDKKIQLQQEKIDLLKQQKKGLMQKIFSQELRFKSKDGSEYPDWKLTTLAEVATSIQYGMNAAAKEYDGENIYLRITDIDDEYRTFLEDSKVSPDASLDEKYRLKEGDILFARTGASVGKSFYFSGENRPFYFAGFLIRVRLKNGINSNFVYQNTLTSSYRRWVKVMSMRSGQPGINGEEYGSFTFKLPCLEEQTKIANFLTKLDKRIILEENKKKMLHKKKEAFMQQMFI